MFARHVSVRLKPDIPNAFNQTFEKQVVSMLHKQAGFRLLLNRMATMSFVSVTVLAVLFLSFLHPLAVAQIPGGTITFNDLSDSLSFSTSAPPFEIRSRVSDDSCFVVPGSGWERCKLTLSFPNPGFAPNVADPLVKLSFDILDPITGSLSDTLVFSPSFDGTNIVITFTSDAEGGAPLISTGDTTPRFETGSVQNIGDLTGSTPPCRTITWSNGAFDCIQFQSDIETPEPSSLLLLGSGLLGLSGIVRRKRVG